MVSDRVAKSADEARAAIRMLFNGATIPDAHRFTAYGLHLAGGEYLDHLRVARGSETYLVRSMLRNDCAKARLANLIRDVATI
jgi:hypothetical protein